MKIYVMTPLLLGCLLGAGVVHAQEPKELTEEDIKRLAAMVDNADKLFGAKKYEEALPIYQDIYNQTKEPTMLYRMALCYQNMEKHKEAVETYRQFLAESPEDNAFRVKAQEAMASEEAKIPKEDPKPKPKPKEKTPLKKSTILYGGAGAAGAAGAVFGILGLREAEGAKSAQAAGDVSANIIFSQQQKANQFALISDIAFVAAIGAGVGGFLLSKKEKEKITLLVGPTKIALSVEF